MEKKFIVIGAGLSGLNIARKITDLNMGSVLVVEKSRGVGGRMATRRTLGSRFDHGAQFYKLKPDVADLHHDWQERGLSHEWFVSSKGNHWCSGSGITALAKSMAEGLEISLEKEIQEIHHENYSWKITSTKNEIWFCENLILSSPTPQTVKLLAGKLNENSLNDLKKISYTKALIALVTLQEDLEIGDNGYVEFSSGDFFSISDQKKKGVAGIPSLTVTMSANFSEEEFEFADNLILEKILKLFMAAYPEAKINGSELKKWRYCQPQTQHKNIFLEIAPKLFLIGDAFGGSSLLGALRSSEALCNYLIECNESQEQE